MKIKFVEINKKVIKNEESKRVYDITVKDDHSYTVNNIIVHNCLTSKNTGVGYPMASLIKECYEIKLTMAKSAKIVADGGFKEYSDIIKALLLGADYVMIGSLLNKSIESSGDNYFRKIKISKKMANFLFKKGLTVKKKFRGMSTKEVQRKWGKKILTTSEGVVRYRPVEYYLDSWVENFDHYLRSAMSYTGCFDLDEFIGCSRYNMITQNAYKRFDK